MSFVTPAMQRGLEWEITQWVDHEGLIWRPSTPWMDNLAWSHLSFQCSYKGLIWRPSTPWMDILAWSHLSFQCSHKKQSRRPTDGDWPQTDLRLTTRRTRLYLWLYLDLHVLVSNTFGLFHWWWLWNNTASCPPPHNLFWVCPNTALSRRCAGMGYFHWESGRRDDGPQDTPALVRGAGETAAPPGGRNARQTAIVSWVNKGCTVEWGRERENTSKAKHRV